MKAYLDILSNIRDKGSRKESRTGVDTTSITGAMFEHDMRTGFPLLTIKKMGIKDIAKELSFFVNGETSKRSLENKGCTIWSEWCSPDKVPYSKEPETQKLMRAEQDLGPIYGYQWRNWGLPYRPAPAIQSPHSLDLKSVMWDDELSKKKHLSKQGPYRILGKRVDAGKVFCTLGFIYTGSILEVEENDLVIDPYFPNVCKVACYGTTDKIPPGEETFYLWLKLIDSFYDPEHEAYMENREQGRYLCNRWLNYSLFLKDVKTLPGYDSWVRDRPRHMLQVFNTYEKKITPKECAFVPSAFVEEPGIDKYLVEAKNLTVLSFPGDMRSFIDNAKIRLNIKETGLTQILKIMKSKGEKVTLLPKSIPLSTKIPKGIDQLKNAIETLKKEPSSRRILVTAWNPSDIGSMALPPCHYGFQLLSDGVHLDLLWNQRSVDTPLGLPYNIASYGLLLSLIAKEVGKVPRKLIGFLADVHFYENQREGVNEILLRTPRDLPRLVIDPEVDLFNWEGEGLSLEGYNPLPPIKIPIAI